MQHSNISILSILFEDGEKEYDEHVWLSLKHSQKFVTKISECLSTIDGNNAETYKTNAKKYNDNLKDLDGKYTSAVNAGTKKTVLFADRFPFRYLVDDYGLDYYAAFVGCSAETEASFETIKFLADKVDELGLSVILQIESSDGKIANTVKNATANKNQTILTMDSAQTTTTKQFAEGRTYLSIMEGNLDVLKQALKQEDKLCLCFLSKTLQSAMKMQWFQKTYLLILNMAIMSQSQEKMVQVNLHY